MKKNLLLSLVVAIAVWAIIPNDPLLINASKSPLSYYGDTNKFRVGLPQWGLLNLGGDATPLYEKTGGVMSPITTIEPEPYLPGADISAAKAWNIRTDCGGVIIAVIDSGVRMDPDITPNLWVNEGEIPDDGVDNDGNGIVDDYHGIAVSRSGIEVTNDLTDHDGHGTAIAGIIGAVGNNGIGGVGVCWKAQIMCLKAELTDASAIRCLKYAIEHGAKVINFARGTRSDSPLLKEAFKELHAAGIICVLSAGNMRSGADERDIDKSPRYPASWGFDNCIVVTSTDARDELYPSACYGKNSVHLAAPGRLISTLGGYDTGTSFAAPFVTGAVALVWSEHVDWTYQQVIGRLLQTVDPLPSLEGKCISGGRLNLFRALAEGHEVTPPILSFTRTEDGRMEVSVILSPYDGAPYVLEGSSNFLDWIALETVRPTERLSSSHRVGSEGSQFFRTRSLGIGD